MKQLSYQEKKALKKVLIYIVILLVLIAIAIPIFIVSKNKQDSSSIPSYDTQVGQVINTNLKAVFDNEMGKQGTYKVTRFYAVNYDLEKDRVIVIYATTSNKIIKGQFTMNMNFEETLENIYSNNVSSIAFKEFNEYVYIQNDSFLESDSFKQCNYGKYRNPLSYSENVSFDLCLFGCIFSNNDKLSSVSDLSYKTSSNEITNKGYFDETSNQNSYVYKYYSYLIY